MRPSLDATLLCIATCTNAQHTASWQAKRQQTDGKHSRDSIDMPWKLPSLRTGAQPNPEVGSPLQPNNGQDSKEQATVTEIPVVTEQIVNDIYAGNEAAKAASDHEQTMTMRYTIKYYFMALFWAAMMAAPIIMEGYETALVPSFFSFKPFKELYGQTSNGNLIVPPAWQSGITISAAVGQLFGLWLAPRVMNRFGYRLCTKAGLAWASICLLIGVLSIPGAKLHIFLVGELLLGVPWGLFQGITLPYVSDITPLKLRGPAATMINIFWLIGQLVSATVLRGSSEIHNPQWSIRLPMLIQYSWLFPLFIIVILAPESPYFLSRQGKDEEARKVLSRVNRDPKFDQHGSLAIIHCVNEHEKKASERMGFMDCFKGVNLRRTEIAVIIYLTQQLVGSPLVFYSVNVLQKAGLTQSHALCVTMGMYLLCIGSTLASMAAMRSFGRRAMWIGGLAAEVACLIIIGTLGFFLESTTAVAWVSAVILVLFAVVYNFTIGPVCYTIVAETPSTRMKTATNSIARGIYIAVSIGNLFLVPNLLEPKPLGWGLGTRAALLWASTSFFCLCWAYFRLPEMKDRTPAQIDVMFERGLPARSWAQAKL
ncbi:trehalose transport-related protein [Cordyceps militaris CM01]|uniref:Trehalose transport-related protein n=1 Tax=Cordyceps militaris (strain CM01) TaxID=983644 RepID=G3JMF6_CORMM|nr:trehalose transport-related protein [Cordyceps militaris CM01]EGX90835.1 trehalose transport-related protein [Cordyceps militaris CM01]